MDRINVRVGEPLKQALETEAAARGTSPSAVVREALERHLGTTTEATCLDLARKIGLVGCAERLPPDLSTNKKHMEGLGRG